MGAWGAAPRQQLRSLLCLTSVKSVKRIWTAGLALPSVLRWLLPLHTQLPGSGPGRPAPLAGLVGQLASATLGAEEGRSCPAGRPEMQGSLGLLLCLCGLHCVFLTGPYWSSCLDLPVCTSVCLNLELSVSLGLVVSSLWACLDVPFSPSVCLLRVWVPIPAVPLSQDAPPTPREHTFTSSSTYRPASPASLPGHSLPVHLTLQTSLWGTAEQPASPGGAQPPSLLTHRPPRPPESPNGNPVCRFSHIPGREQIGPNSIKSLAYQQLEKRTRHRALRGTFL